MDPVICSNCWRSEARHVDSKCILKMDSDEATVSDWMRFNPITSSEEEILEWVETPRVDDDLDQVNAPAHYTDGRQYETWDVIVDWKLSYLLGNSIKYISRAGRKGEARQDIQKAIAYLEKHLEGLDE